jgi:hypothetical protein
LNVWALHKDVQLKHFMLLLLDAYGTGNISLSKRWQDDTKALGVYKPDNEAVLVYVFIHGQASGKFGVHLHYPEFTDDNTGRYEDLGLDNLLELVGMHLDLVPQSNLYNSNGVNNGNKKN